MFKRNDYALLAARILLICYFLAGALLCPVISIWLAVKIHWSYIFIIFPLLAAVCIAWIIGRLILSFFCDIKLIRNKLYENSNDKLEVFFKSRKEIIKSNNKENNDEVINCELIDLQQTLHKDSNIEEPEIANNVEHNDNKGKNGISKANIISVAIAIVLSLLAVLIILLTRIL